MGDAGGGGKSGKVHRMVFVYQRVGIIGELVGNKDGAATKRGIQKRAIEQCV